MKRATSSQEATMSKKATYTVFCGGNGCQFLKSGLAKRQAEREATGHRCCNPDAHLLVDKS